MPCGRITLNTLHLPCFFFLAQCIREKMDVIDLEDEQIDAEVLNSMAVTQVRHRPPFDQLLCDEVEGGRVVGVGDPGEQAAGELCS